MFLLFNSIRGSHILLMTMLCVTISGLNAQTNIYITATDNDGWAHGRAYFYQYDSERRDYVYVTEQRLVNGKCSRELAPGMYRISVSYTETLPNQRKEIDNIQVSDMGTLSYDFYFEKGSIWITATDHDGWAHGRIYYYQYDSERRDYVYVTEQRLVNGKCSRELAPGTYRIRISYTETAPAQNEEIINVQISDRENLPFEFYFKKGDIDITAYDYDGWANGRVYYYKYNSERRDYAYVTEQRLVNGKCSRELAPGMYRISITYTETAPVQNEELINIQVSDKGNLPYEFYFKKGEIKVTATDNDGWANGRAYYYKFDSGKRDYVYVTEQRLVNGKCSKALSPGIYKISCTYSETQPAQRKEVENIKIFDSYINSQLFEYGSSIYSPPVISLNGPYESVIENGVIDPGEAVEFKVSTSDEDFNRAEIKINGQDLATIQNTGVHTFRYLPPHQGKYTIEVIAFDNMNPSNINSISLTFTISNTNRKGRIIEQSKHQDTGTGKQYPGQSAGPEHKWINQPVRVKVENKTYLLGKINSGGRRYLFATDLQNNIIKDRDLLEKIFFIQHVYRFSYATPNTSFRIQLLDSEIDDLNESLNVFYLSDVVLFLREGASRALTEVLLAAISGGSTTVKTLSKEAALAVTKAFVKDPVNYAKGMNYLTLQSVSENLSFAKASILNDTQTGALSYERAKQIDKALVSALSRKNPSQRLQAQLLLHQGGGGDLVSQLQHVGFYMGDQLIADVVEPFKYKTVINESILGAKTIAFLIQNCPDFAVYINSINSSQVDYGYKTGVYFNEVIREAINHQLMIQ